MFGQDSVSLACGSRVQGLGFRDLGCRDLGLRVQMLVLQGCEGWSSEDVCGRSAEWK